MNERVRPTRVSHPGPARAQIAPRKLPRQSRAADTVDAIVEAAAQILEGSGKHSYTTNIVAERAGVSIGSLYQYFPNKDAITRALIMREARAMAAQARRALTLDDLDLALMELVGVAVRHQLGRPRLTCLLEAEEQRLDYALDLEQESAAVRAELVARLRTTGVASNEAATVASDIVQVIRTLADAAGSRAVHDPERSIASIGGAVRGLVSAAVQAR